MQTKIHFFFQYYYAITAIIYFEINLPVFDNNSYGRGNALIVLYDLHDIIVRAA